MKKSLHVLHVEDSPEDSELVTEMLSKSGLPCRMKRIETRAQLFDALQTETFDIVLADCRLPNFSGLQALEITHALKPEVPFIFVSGTIGEETAIESLRNGATDYVLKHRLSRLVPAVRRAMAEAEERILCHELQQRLQQARRIEAISTLANGIAHDFNNILTIILGHASLLTTEYREPKRVLEITGTITQAGQRASQIVEQLLAFARKSDGHVAPLDLNHFVKGYLPILQAKATGNVEIVFTPGGGLPEISADRHQMGIILEHLLTNSLESMPGGGKIVLSTKLVPASQSPELVPPSLHEHFVCLQVTDGGRGMDEATLQHAFEPFYTTKERGQATGLGLPVVYGLVQAQNGVVHLESEPGKGTTASLFFPPILPTETPSATVSREVNPGLRGTEMVLVVEDEPDINFFLETILKSHGYEVLAAHDHREAIKMFADNVDRIALVFSDIGLPHMDGITLCRQLRELRRDVPVILASGYPSKEFAEKLGDLAPAAFLSKPYQTQDILENVKKALSGTKA